MQALSLRLKTIADLIPKGVKVCDVGTDHGYLAIYIREMGIAQSVIATDVNEKPLNRARKNIETYGKGGIELRLCDGLEGLSCQEADTVVIAGMGGEVIAGILERGRIFSFNSSVTFIIQPTTSPEFLRRFLCENGFEVFREVPIEENTKIYSVMECRFTGNKTSPGEGFYYVGKVKPDCPAGVKYIEKQKKRLMSCIKALEGKSEKAELFERYRSAFDEI